MPLCQLRHRYCSLATRHGVSHNDISPLPPTCPKFRSRAHSPNAHFLIGEIQSGESEKGRLGGSMAASLPGTPAVTLFFIFVIARMPPPSPTTAPPERMPTDVIWLNSPGPGGGGGGGGNKNPDPPKKADCPARRRSRCRWRSPHRHAGAAQAGSTEGAAAEYPGGKHRSGYSRDGGNADRAARCGVPGQRQGVAAVPEQAPAGASVQDQGPGWGPAPVGARGGGVPSRQRRDHADGAVRSEAELHRRRDAPEDPGHRHGRGRRHARRRCRSGPGRPLARSDLRSRSGSREGRSPLAVPPRAPALVRPVPVLVEIELTFTLR